MISSDLSAMILNITKSEGQCLSMANAAFVGSDLEQRFPAQARCLMGGIRGAKTEGHDRAANKELHIVPSAKPSAKPRAKPRLPANI